MVMKRLMCLILVLGLAGMFGCAQEQPEAAAKKVFEQQVAVHEGLELDTSGLAYTLVEQEGDTALVEVSGNMAVKAEILLVKKGGQWAMDVPADEATEEDPIPTEEKAPSH
jgi:hypothetical protein